VLITYVVDDTTAFRILMQAWTAGNKAKKAIWVQQMAAETEAQANAEQQAHEVQALQESISVPLTLVGNARGTPPGIPLPFSIQNHDKGHDLDCQASCSVKKKVR
jgi:hypothetical protein